MKKQIQDMNTELTQDAKKLSDDISNFFDYIQSNYEAASASFQKVVDLAKSNYKKLEQLNDMEDKLFVLQSELRELEQQLLECLMCYAFLGEVASEDYGEIERVLPKQFLRSFGPKFADEDFVSIQKNVLEDILEDRIIIEPIQKDVNSEDVLRFLEHFKHSNFSLVRNNHVRNNYFSNLPSSIINMKTESSQKMKDEIDEWNMKISRVEKDLEKAKEKNDKLENQINHLLNEDPDGTKLNRENELKKITEIYKLCTNSEVQYMDIALMKVAIEDSLDNLFKELDVFPKKKVKELLKMLDAEKKLSERKVEEALRAQRAFERKKNLIQSKKEKKRIGS
nr:uncharacterized protein LOC122269649 [Parasteatoda tepidariorum]